MGITQQSLPRLAAGKLLQPLNPELLPNSTNVAPALADPYYDKGAVYTRPYIVYKTGITYRTDFVEPSVVEEKGWDILWDPAYKGYVGLLDDSRETISLALLYAGETDLNTGDQAKLDQAVTRPEGPRRQDERPGRRRHLPEDPRRHLPRRAGLVG